MAKKAAAATPAEPAAAGSAARLAKYEHAKIEAKWQKKWEKVQLYRSVSRAEVWQALEAARDAGLYRFQ